MAPMEGQASCPICTRPASKLLEKLGYPLHRCDECDHIFVAPVPSPDELAALYSVDAGYMAESPRAFSPDGDFSPKFVERIERIAALRPGGRLLDVGSAHGELLYLAEQRGFEAFGVELNEGTARASAAAGLRVFNGRLEDAPYEPGSFDVVHLGDLIEHVPEPGALVRTVAGLLRPDGLLVVATPNHDAFFPAATFWLFRRLGVPWSHPTPPHHLHQFSVRSLHRLLEREGFAVESEYFSPITLGYEIRATGAFAQLKRALRERRAAGVLRHALEGAGVLLTYPCVAAADRWLVRDERDFYLHVLASRGGVAPG